MVQMLIHRHVGAVQSLLEAVDRIGNEQREFACVVSQLRAQSGGKLHNGERVCWTEAYRGRF